MSTLRILTMSEQIAVRLREELARGRWSGTMPGRAGLARQLGVGITSMEEALRQLEREGLLANRGAGRMRRIIESNSNTVRRRLRIAVLTHERAAMGEGYMAELIHHLGEAGHEAFFTRNSLLDLGFNLRRIARLVEEIEADAWIVCSASREVTEWFAAQPKPAFSLFGRRRGVPIASVGPDKSPAYAAATRRLIEHGHQRIVLLVRPDRRLPVPGTPERAFLAELAAHGIMPGPYHLPDWDEGIDGFQTQLEKLFHVTPPTALIVDEMMLFVATQQFLARKRLRVPEEVSLVILESDSAFEWCRPSVAHIRWGRPPVLRRVVGWANNIARGKKDLRETLTRAEFIDGGTIGPARK
jgi:DNA-binding LacI/PurR family transcriptional regulator/DNA-binding transcriptional regulator YhcF (GntR family)